MALRPEPTPAHEPRRLGFRERSRLRRRVRFLRKRRELELRDLGGLVFDMYRFGSKRQDLVRDKLQGMFAADRELREFEQLLGRRPRRLDVREAGIGGACRNCQQLYSTEAHFCSRCGQTLTDGTRPDMVIEAPAVGAPAAYSPAPEPAHEPVYEPQPQARQAPEPQDGGGGRRFGRRRRKAPEPQPAQPWQSAEPQTPAGQDAEPQTPAGQDAEPQTPAWQDAEPQTPAAQPRTPAWQAPALQPRAAEPQDEGSGRRFGRRLRKTLSKGAVAAEETQRQQQDWEAQYQASVEAQRQAWQDEEARSAPSEREDQTRAWQAEPEASPREPGSDGQDDRHDPAAPVQGGFSGLEAGDPLASRSSDRRR